MNERKLYYRYEDKNENTGIFVLRERMLFGRQCNCFETKEDATNHFKEAEKIANEKYDKIMDEIVALKDIVGDFSIDGWAEANDDSGLCYGGIIEFEVNGYSFTFRQ